MPAEWPQFSSFDPWEFMNDTSSYCSGSSVFIFVLMEHGERVPPVPQIVYEHIQI